MTNLPPVSAGGMAELGQTVAVGQPQTSTTNAPSVSSPDATAPRGLTVAAVARRLGVAPATLRTWDRRYGLGPGSHAPGSHRRYGPDDVERLRVMQDLVRSGIPVADAAVEAREWSPDAGASDRADPEAAIEPAAEPDAAVAAAGARLVRGLSAASAAMDAAQCAEILRTSLADRGADWTWDNLLRPVLAAIGRTWERTGTGTEVEHLLSNIARTELAAHAAAVLDSDRGGAARGAGRPLLFACAPDDEHDLPLFALAAALAERGRRALLLGARTPAAALAAAVRRLGPEAIVVWACLPVADPSAALDLPTIRPKPRVVLVGPGWPAGAPGRASTATDLSGAVTQVLRPA